MNREAGRSARLLSRTRAQSLIRSALNFAILIREKNMNRLAGTILIVCAGVGVALADAPAPPAAAKGPSVSETIKQLERDWTDAMKAGDVDKAGQIVADDWTGLGYDGSKDTKRSYLADMQSGKDKVESVEFGPMDVKVLGNVAVVQGSDTEKSTSHGKDTSGKWVWMDVFVKRDGKWVVVRSESAMVK
jgi:ketosteroid isomerase-like protein